MTLADTPVVAEAKALHLRSASYPYPTLATPSPATIPELPGGQPISQPAEWPIPQVTTLRSSAGDTSDARSSHSAAPTSPPG